LLLSKKAIRMKWKLRVNSGTFEVVLT